MKILVLTFYFTPDLSAGSFRSSAFVKSLKKNLKDEDTVEIVTTLPNRYKTYDVSSSAFEKIEENISIYRIDVGSHKSGFIDQSKSFSKFFLETYKITKNKNYDIVFATSSRLMTAFLGSMISKRNKAKLYLDIRDIFTDTMESIFTKRNSKLRYLLPIFKFIEKRTILNADHINLVSEGFIEHFKQINKKDIYSFYTNGIDSEFLNYDYSKSKSEKKTFTYAGNIGEGQGLENIIPKIASILNEYEIVIVGDGGRKKQLMEVLRINNVQNVTVKNPVSRNELLQIYKNSDILFLHLNDYEAFKKVLPSKIFEYAATNKFIVAGVDGYAKKFINTYVPQSIVFRPNDERDFYEKFKKINLEDMEIDRDKFIEQFKRENIMDIMAKEVYCL